MRITTLLDPKTKMIPLNWVVARVLSELILTPMMEPKPTKASIVADAAYNPSPSITCNRSGSDLEAWNITWITVTATTPPSSRATMTAACLVTLITNCIDAEYVIWYLKILVW